MYKKINTLKCYLHNYVCHKIHVAAIKFKLNSLFRKMLRSFLSSSNNPDSSRYQKSLMKSYIELWKECFIK